MKVISASILSDFVVKVEFDDKWMVINFNEYVSKLKGWLEKYKNPLIFKESLKIEYGDLIFGENWDLHWKIDDLYFGKIGIVVNESYKKNLKLTVTQYSKIQGVSRQAILNQIKNNKLPTHIIFKKIGNQYVTEYS